MASRQVPLAVSSTTVAGSRSCGFKILVRIVRAELRSRCEGTGGPVPPSAYGESKAWPTTDRE
jgi:hypothetical protein